MPKHKLFIPDDCIPLCIDMKGSLNDNEAEKEHNAVQPTNLTEKVVVVSSKRKNNQTTPVSSKIVKPNFGDLVNEGHPAFWYDFENSEPSTSTREKKETQRMDVEKSDPVSSTLYSGFDGEDVGVLYRNHVKLPYSYKEDEVILKYVLRGQNIFRVSSLTLWKCLEAKKDNPKRTFQSLKNRFLRNIKPYLLTTYKHLIDNEETLDKILKKFPELKNQKGSRTLSQIKVPIKKIEESLALDSDSEVNDVDVEKKPTNTFVLDSEQEEVRNTVWISSLHKSSDERTVRFNQNVIEVSLNFDNVKCVEVKKSIGLSERFQNIKMDKERVSCPTCGRFYRRPVSKDFSGSDAESDILIPDSVDTEKNTGTENNSAILGKNWDDMGAQIILRSDSLRNNAVSQNLLVSFEKSDKSDRNSEESSSLLEEVSQKDEGESVVEITEETAIETKSESSSNGQDSDIDLIYEHTVARFHKLINADEEKTLQRKCLNKDRDSIGFNASAEKNLDSFFLETPLEMETPSLTNDLPTQLQVKSKTTPSQRITRSSALASNMIKMLGREKENLEKL